MKHQIASALGALFFIPYEVRVTRYFQEDGKCICDSDQSPLGSIQIYGQTHPWKSSQDEKSLWNA